MISKNDKIVLNGVLIFSILTLIIAYFIQYILKHEPCNLCLIERYPYIGAIILISFLLMTNKFERTLIYLILSLFVFGAVVSAYHVGIEQEIFNESFVCDLDNNEGSLSKEELLQQLEKKTPISCKIVTFRVFGLSLATINAIISLILSGIMIKVLKRYGKN